MQLSPQALPAWQTLQQAKPNGVPHTGAAALIEPTAISAMLAKKAFTALPSIRARMIPCIFFDPKQRTIVPGGHPRAGARRRRQIRRSIQDHKTWAADRKKHPPIRRARAGSLETEVTFDILMFAEVGALECMVHEGRLAETRVFGGSASNGRHFGSGRQNLNFVLSSLLLDPASLQISHHNDDAKVLPGKIDWFWPCLS